MGFTGQRLVALAGVTAFHEARGVANQAGPPKGAADEVDQTGNTRMTGKRVRMAASQDVVAKLIIVGHNHQALITGGAKPDATLASKGKGVISVSEPRVRRVSRDKARGEP